MQNKIELYGNEEYLVTKDDYVPNFQIKGPVTFMPSQFPRKAYAKQNTSVEAKSDFSFLRKLISKYF